MRSLGVWVLWLQSNVGSSDSRVLGHLSGSWSRIGLTELGYVCEYLLFEQAAQNQVKISKSSPQGALSGG